MLADLTAESNCKPNRSPETLRGLQTKVLVLGSKLGCSSCNTFHTTSTGLVPDPRPKVELLVVEWDLPPNQPPPPEHRNPA